MLQSYSQFPPVASFKRVLQHSPNSAIVYASMWDKRDKMSTRSAFSKSKIKKMFFISQTLFRNHMTALGGLELITFEETPELFLIDFRVAYENQS